MNKTHILIIDGDKNSAQAMADLLESRSYRTDVTHTNGDALDQINHFPDLILLDINLPGTSGLTVYERLQLTERTAGIPVIFVTGEAVDWVRERMPKSSNIRLMIKPLEIPDVLKAAAQLVGGIEVTEPPKDKSQD